MSPTQQQDPFDTLHDRLLVAAGGSTDTGRGRQIAVIAGVLVLCLAGAAVAAVALTDDEPKKQQARTSPTPSPAPSPSPPPSTATPSPQGTPRPNTTPRPPGTAVPRPPMTTIPPSGVPTALKVELMPALEAGTAGWCVGVTVPSSGVRATGRNCENAGPPGSNLIAAGGQNGLVYAVVDRSVALLELSDGRHITPERDPGLPPAWRLATYDVRVRGGGRPPTFTLRDSAGRELAARPAQAGRGALPTREIDPKHPPKQRCGLRVSKGRGVRALSERLLADFETLDVVRPSFLACSSMVLTYKGRRYTAGVLLNARDLLAPAPPLPDAPNSISARRTGTGWLTVFGGRITDREKVLKALRLTRRP